MSNALQLGVRLREFDELFELCATEGSSSREEVLRMKEVRKAILAMRARTYVSGKKAG